MNERCKKGDMSLIFSRVDMAEDGDRINCLTFLPVAMLEKLSRTSLRVSVPGESRYACTQCIEWR